MLPCSEYKKDSNEVLFSGKMVTRTVCVRRFIKTVAFIDVIAILLSSFFQFQESNFKETSRPLCVHGILSRNSVNHLHCRLHHYQFKDVVTCIDEILFRRSQLQRRPVQIAFIGESTVRNQFKSLLRVYFIISLSRNH